jgi:hypothetical protein
MNHTAVVASSLALLCGACSARTPASVVALVVVAERAARRVRRPHRPEPTATTSTTASAGLGDRARAHLRRRRRERAARRVLVRTHRRRPAGPMGRARRGRSPERRERPRAARRRRHRPALPDRRAGRAGAARRARQRSLQDGVRGESTKPAVWSPGTATRTTTTSRGPTRSRTTSASTRCEDGQRRQLASWSGRVTAQRLARVPPRGSRGPPRGLLGRPARPRPPRHDVHRARPRRRVDQGRLRHLLRRPSRGGALMADEREAAVHAPRGAHHARARGRRARRGLRGRLTAHRGPRPPRTDLRRSNHDHLPPRSQASTPSSRCRSRRGPSTGSRSA